jgi:hypothetical protein
MSGIRGYDCGSKRKKQPTEAMIEAAVANHRTINRIFNNVGITIFYKCKKKRALTTNRLDRSLLGSPARNFLRIVHEGGTCFCFYERN